MVTSVNLCSVKDPMQLMSFFSANNNYADDTIRNLAQNVIYKYEYTGHDRQFLNKLTEGGSTDNMVGQIIPLGTNGCLQ